MFLITNLEKKIMTPFKINSINKINNKIKWKIIFKENNRILTQKIQLKKIKMKEYIQAMYLINLKKRIKKKVHNLPNIKINEI
jgi:hypothetical protein